MNRLIERLIAFIENPMHRWVKVEYFPDGEVVFYIYETEIPIYVYKNKENEWVVELVVENNVDTKFCAGMMKELYFIMEFIEENLKYIVIEE